MSLNLNTPISLIGLLGKKNAKDLKRLEVETARDLLFCFPNRYDDFRQISPIGKLTDDAPRTVKATVESIRNRRSFKRRQIITEAIVRDESGSIPVVWFHQPFIARLLNVGDEIFLSGKASRADYGFQLVGPVYEKVTRNAPIHTARLVPIYPLSGDLTQKQVRWLVKTVLPLSRALTDWLPQAVRQKFALSPLGQAIQAIHFPNDESATEKARRRMKFDEIFTLLARAASIRASLKTENAENVNFFEKETREFVSSLPFKLTEAQRKVAWTILQDMRLGRPMNRLLNGDVGSGKTVVAAIAALNAAKNNLQTAFMAPTEILAAQHFETFVRLFAPHKLKIALATANAARLFDGEDTYNDIKKTDIYRLAEKGGIDCLFGTHSLLNEKLKFARLALAVVDEQHRFGVEQRKALREKNGEARLTPHLLSMTATPIPRTLALTIYGDLDISVMDAVPTERKEIKTQIILLAERDKIYELTRKELAAGRQCFIVCPLIEQSERLNAAAVAEAFLRYQKIFPEFRLGLLHGKMKPKEKSAAMNDFVNGRSQILISTQVVEVGVDVKNAVIMIIESAERFGLAQLHQLRGRVGRSAAQAYCFAFTTSDDGAAFERLSLFANSTNGFELAEADLKLRGPGDFYGIKQSGPLPLRIAALSDRRIIEEAQVACREIFTADPGLTNYPLLRLRLAQLDEKVHWE